MAKNDIILDDTELRIPIYSPVCTFCKWLLDWKTRTCKAFPEGIPMGIWLGDDEHDSVRTDQVGDYVLEKS